MEFPSKILEQIASNTGPKIEEQLLTFMHRSNPEEHLFQPLQSNIKLIEIAYTFLTGYNGILNVTDKNNKFLSQNQFLMKMVLYKFLYLQVLTKSKV